MVDVEVDTTEDPEGKGPARFVRSVRGNVDFGVRYAVRWAGPNGPNIPLTRAWRTVPRAGTRFGDCFVPSSPQGPAPNG